MDVFARTYAVTSKIISLAAVRAVLAERFPQAAAPPARFWETGWPALEGAIPLGALAEVCSRETCGRLFLDRVLSAVRRRGDWAGLIEVECSMDFAGERRASWARVLGGFCKTTVQAVQAADLLLRDGNLTLVLLDLQTAPSRDLGRISASTWHRFQRLAERSGTALVVLTPQPMVEAARVRIALDGRWDLAALRRPRAELFAQMKVQVFHRRRNAQPTAEPLAQTA